MVAAIIGGAIYLSNMNSQLIRLSADVAELRADMKDVKSYTRLTDLQNDQIRDLQKENNRNDMKR